MSDHIFDCADAEPVTLARKKKVKARKTHQCLECHHPILPGEVYWLNSWLFEGEWEAVKMCVCCERARCAVADAYVQGSFQACINLGHLWDAIKDGLRDGWLKRENIGDLPKGVKL